MTVIQLPDEQAAALRAKASAQGLTLEDWLGRLAAIENGPTGAQGVTNWTSWLPSAICPRRNRLTIEHGWTLHRSVARHCKVERGDIYHVDLNPTRGREQAGARYVVIVSPRAFNILGTPLAVQSLKAGILRDMPALQLR